MEFVRAMAKEWAKVGIITITDEKPFCVSPLTVVEKTNEQGIIKRRLCLDLSRHVNLCLQQQQVTLAHLQRAVGMTEQGDYQTKYYLTSAYFHIKIEEAHKKFLGASFQEEDSSTVFFSI